MKASLQAVSVVLMASSSVMVSAKKVEMTPMELQALQSREYQTTKDQLFASIVSVFQDLGYQIVSADMPSGFITAESANKNKTSFLEAFGGANSSGNTRATAFVETMPSGMSKVRLNFLNTKNMSGAYGRQSRNDKPVLDPQTYQIAFQRIEEALFERNALTKGGGTNAPASEAKPAVAVPVTPGLSITDQGKQSATPPK